MTVEIYEDPRARAKFARDVASSMLCSRRLHALFVVLAAVLSVGVEAVARARGHNPPLSAAILLFSFVALQGVVLSGTAYLSYRLLPQRWILRPDRISLRWRELRSLKYRALESFEVESLENPVGSTFFAVHSSNGRKYSLVADASSAISAAEEELSRRLTRRCS